MSRVRAQKPKLVVAGPGAGKTHGMVDRIIEALPSLNPCRYLAAITFTNSAANNIRGRVHRAARPGSNVFIGTIHSFVNRFVIAPFARPLKLLPSDRIFAAVEINDRNGGASKRRMSPIAKNARRQAIINKLLRKGIVPYDQMVRLCNELLDNKVVLDRVSSRLQFLFIDEFQDVNTQQLEIFKKLQKENRTRIFAVGDPEQYIYSFTYRGVRAPTFENIPFFRFRQVADDEPLNLNRRSCCEIVDFTNHFREDVKQHSTVGPRRESRVLFLGQTALADIIGEFRKRSDLIPVQRGDVKRLYLAYRNAAFDMVRDQFGIRHFSNGARHHLTLLQDALELLTLCHGASQGRSVEELRITSHEWRKWGLALLRELRDNQSLTVKQFLNIWLPKLDVSSGFDERKNAVSDTFDHLKAAVAAGARKFSEDWSCSIHRAKGLEANAVLVVASSLKELKKWCTTDRVERNADKKDTCRVGFVGFTRAMELLCIACCDPLDSETYTHLQSLGVKICSPFD
jgi:DNA helicase-2/ATP-dependent DNA helicase PcrA